jgi:Fe2+ or Zn2+ uptake regulation protein
MAKRGRVVGSVIRDNLVELLFHINKAHAYELYKHYKKVYGPVSIRSIYYNLTKGKDLGVFEIKEIQKVEGNFSWGPSAQRIIFALGKTAQPKGDSKVKDMLGL